MAATSTCSDSGAASEGPVLSVISKRLRALRKKLNRITQMEDSLAQGKTLNKEQQDVLRSKPAVIAIIDELEKLRSPLSAAVDEEISSKSKSFPSEEKQKYSSDNDDNHTNTNDDDEIEGPEVKDLLYLMYFGSLFDVKPQSDFTSLMLTRTHERGCCLTYDYVTDDATELLVERDLDLISALQGLMISRPPNSALSHQNALERCIHHAKLWLTNSDQPIDPQSNITYSGLREKLNKIMASDYFTATPQMKGPGEVAAAAAVGNFGSFQVPIHDGMVPVEVQGQVEGSVEKYPDTEEKNYGGYETGEHQIGSGEEFQKEDLEAENPPEAVSAQTEQDHLQAEEEQGYRNVDFKEQQYIHRRGSRGGRGGGGGGGRRGYPNGRGGRGSGRGGGPYQNGRSQYYDNYNSRGYYNKRGGRGGNVYQNHSAADQGNHAQANVGVAS